MSTPQMVQILHTTAGWGWTVYDGHMTQRGCEASFAAAWACVSVRVAPPQTTHYLAARIDAEAGPV